MASLVSKTRVAWAFVVVNVNGVKSLHLIKKSYRGNIAYYSNSARGVVDKIGFGEVGYDLFVTFINGNKIF